MERKPLLNIFCATSSEFACAYDYKGLQLFLPHRSVSGITAKSNALYKAFRIHHNGTSYRLQDVRYVDLSPCCARGWTQITVGISIISVMDIKLSGTGRKFPGDRKMAELTYCCILVAHISRSTVSLVV